MITTSLVGDDLIRSPRKIITHSIIINAPSEEVWPWLVQLGSGRAGWYSYDRIDNGGSPSAKEIIPQLQNIAVGDIMPAVPGSRDAFIVQQVSFGKVIVLVVPIKTANEEASAVQRMTGQLRVSWVLALKSLDEKHTRLISRCRISNEWLAKSKSPAPSKKPIFIERIYGLLAKMPWFIMIPIATAGHSLMESRMLRGIKWRAEKAFKQKSKQESGDYKIEKQ